MCWTATSQDLTQAAAIRRSVAAYLKERVQEREALLDAEIVIGELLANAVRHASGKFCADVEWRDGKRPVLIVHDAGRCFAGYVRPAGAFAESGRGMEIVRALAEEVRIRRVHPQGCIVTAALRLTLRDDAPYQATPCPRGERRWDLGCACALEMHGLDPSDANVEPLASAD